MDAQVEQGGDAKGAEHAADDRLGLRVRERRARQAFGRQGEALEEEHAEGGVQVEHERRQRTGRILAHLRNQLHDLHDREDEEARAAQTTADGAAVARLDREDDEENDDKDTRNDAKESDSRRNALQERRRRGAGRARRNCSLVVAPRTQATQAAPAPVALAAEDARLCGIPRWAARRGGGRTWLQRDDRVLVGHPVARTGPDAHASWTQGADGTRSALLRGERNEGASEGGWVAFVRAAPAGRVGKGARTRRAVVNGRVAARRSNAFR